MSEHDQSQQGINEKVQQAKEKVGPAAEQITATVTDLRDRLDPEQVKALALNNAVQLVTAIAVVGILINNRRSLKFTKRIVKNMDVNMINTQQTIMALKKAGQDFTFYPGVGVYVD